MKKITRNFILSSLMILPLSGSLVSCGPTTGGSSADDSGHIMSYSETSDYLLRQGQTSYRVLVPSSMSSEIQSARDELVRFFQEATGVTLSVVTDGNYSANSDERIISLGNTKAFEQSGIVLDKDQLKRDGIRILTKGKGIYVCGTSDVSIIYGVYDLLSLLFDFEAYTPTTYKLNTGVTDVRLASYDVTDIPDIEFRMRRGLMNPSTSSPDDTMFAYRMRHLDGYGQKYLPIHLGNSKTSSWKVDHNSFYYFPLDEYLESHPKFYSNDVTQLCFTAHGDAEELEIMTDLAAQKIEQSLTWYLPSDYPEYIGVEFGMNDTPYLCSCNACQALSAKHNGAISATIITFLQKMGKKVNDWMDLPENANYKRPLQYMFLAYQAASKPPIKKLADGSFEYDESILPHDGVSIVPFVASMGLDYGKPFYSSANDEGREYISTWGTFFPGSWAWSYGGFFNDYLTFYDLISFYTDYHAFLKKYNYAFTFQQCHDDQKGADTGFGSLLSYLMAKKAWNSSLSMSAMIDDFMENVYLEAAKPMKNMLQRLRLWFAEQTAEKGWGGSAIQISVSSNKKYWTIGLVKELIKYTEEAYEAVSIYKKNASLYKKLTDAIDTEWLLPAKVIIDCYEDEVSADEYSEIKKRFKTICKNLNVKDIREFVSINSYLDSL